MSVAARVASCRSSVVSRAVTVTVGTVICLGRLGDATAAAAPGVPGEEAARLPAAGTTVTSAIDAPNTRLVYRGRTLTVHLTGALRQTVGLDPADDADRLLYPESLWMAGRTEDGTTVSLGLSTFSGPGGTLRAAGAGRDGLEERDALPVDVVVQVPDESQAVLAGVGRMSLVGTLRSFPAHGEGFRLTAPVAFTDTAGFGSGGSGGDVEGAGGGVVATLSRFSSTRDAS